MANLSDAALLPIDQGHLNVIMLNRYLLAIWVTAIPGLEGPLDAILKLLRAVREILEIIRSL